MKIFKNKLINGVLFTPEMMYKSYQMYHSINQRCYNKKRLTIQPSYIGSVNNFEDVDDFRSWLIENEFFCYNNLSIDKDILNFNSSKVYSRDTCILLPKELNRNLIGFVKSFNSTKVYTTSSEKYQLLMNINSDITYFQCYQDQEDYINNYRYISSYKILKYIELNKNQMPVISYNKIIDSKFYEFITYNSKLINPTHKFKIDELI